MSGRGQAPLRRLPSTRVERAMTDVKTTTSRTGFRVY
jgi:hypothetical protein